MKPREKTVATKSHRAPNKAVQRRPRRTNDRKATVESAPPSARLLSADGCLTIRIPLTFARRSGRKRIITPDGKTFEPVSQGDEAMTLVKAIARAHRWKRLLEDGRYSSMQDLAAAEKVTPSFLARILRLTLLAPDIVEQIIWNPDSTGNFNDALTRPFPPEWDAQRAMLVQLRPLRGVLGRALQAANVPVTRSPS